MTQIAGAVVASGLVAVEGGSKRVQHQEGGIVAEILVRNEDKVEAGQLLVRLDGTSIRANLDVVLSQLREALSRQARLVAESTGAAEMKLASIAANWPEDAELDAMMKSQDLLRLSRAAALKGQSERLDEQIAQSERGRDQGAWRSRKAPRPGLGPGVAGQ
jgi:HlyD family secretion protein